jgi:hypothetical protein
MNDKGRERDERRYAGTVGFMWILSAVLAAEAPNEGSPQIAPVESAMIDREGAPVFRSLPSSKNMIELTPGVSELVLDPKGSTEGATFHIEGFWEEGVRLPWSDLSLIPEWSTRTGAMAMFKIRNPRCDSYSPFSSMTERGPTRGDHHSPV